MGVKKLFTYIDENLSKVSESVQLPLPNKERRTVLVDGFGFCITVAQKAVAYQIHLGKHPSTTTSAPDGVVAPLPVAPDSDMIGGDAFVVAEAARSCLEFLCHELNLNLVFAMDAPRGVDGPTSDRDATWDQRAKETQALQTHYFKYAQGSVSSKVLKMFGATKEPIPKLTTATIVSVMKEFECQFSDSLKKNCPLVQRVVVDCEVDDIVPLLVAKYNASLVLTGDTDLMISPIPYPTSPGSGPLPGLSAAFAASGVPVAPLQYLPWQRLMPLGATAKKKKGMELLLVSRVQIAATMGVVLPTADKSKANTKNDDGDDEDAAGLSCSSATALGDDETLFYLAASLSGNDATAKVCDCGRIDVVVKELLIQRRKNKFSAATENKKKSSSDGADGEKKDDDVDDKEKVGGDVTPVAAADEWKWERFVRHQKVQDSVAAYLGVNCRRYSTSPFVETHLPTVKLWSTLGTDTTAPAANGTFPGGAAHPVWKQNLPELELFLKLYSEGAVSSQYLPKMLSGLSFDGLEPFEFGAVPTALPPMEVLPTFKHVEGVERSMMKSQRKSGGAATTSDAEDGNQKEEFPSWYTVRTQYSASEKEALCGKTFSHGATSASSFHEAVMWLIHPALYAEELMPVVAMLKMMDLRQKTTSDEKEQQCWRTIYNKLCDRESATGVLVDEVPTTRCLEIACLLAQAYQTVSSFSNLIGGGFSSTAAASGGGAGGIPSPDAFFSATLLHILLLNGGPVWKEAIKEETTLLKDIDLFTGACRRKFSPAQTSDTHARRYFMGEEQDPPGFGVLGGCPPMISRFSHQWIGVLHRDELADQLDQGEAVVEEGGHIIPGKKQQQQQQQQSALLKETSNPLPILDYMDEILEKARLNNVVCIQGETGCGKSSMIPLHLLLDAEKRRERVCIIVTQPRRIAATSLAQRVASLLGEEVGERIGYRIGGGSEYHVESSKTVVRFVTTGYLLESIAGGSRSKIWRDCTHILLDEVHERSLQADMLSLVLKLTIGEEKDEMESVAAEKPWMALEQKKLIIMSATIQADMFRNYFGPLQPKDPNALPGSSAALPVPTLFVGARRCKVDEYYLNEWQAKHSHLLPPDVADTVGKYVKALSKNPAQPSLKGESVRAVADLALSSVAPGTCILVFLPGLEEIENVLEAINVVSRRLQGHICTLKIHTLHSIVDIEEQKRVVAETASTECKIVLATNIAETSLTIPDVKVVIDAGMQRRMEYDAQRRVRALKCVWCSRSSVKQRAGRAGRVTDGIVIRMYTKSTVDKLMRDFDPSEFLPLEYSLLQIRSHLHQYGSILDVMAQLIEPPPEDAILDALSRLLKWGALGEAPEYEVTELGDVALAMPIDVSLTKAILTAAAFGCAAEMIVIASGLTCQRPVFMRPMRNFYDSDLDFTKSLIDTCRTIQDFDRGLRSDLHTFLWVYEEFAHLDRFKQMKKKDLHNWQLAMRQIQTLVKYVKQIATGFLRQNIALQPADLERVQHLAGVDPSSDRNSSRGGRRRNQEGGRQKPAAAAVRTTRGESLLKFDVLENPLKERMLLLALSSASEMAIRAKRVPKGPFFSSNQNESHFGTAGGPCPAKQLQRTIVFEKLQDTIILIGAEGLTRAFDDLTGLRCIVRLDEMQKKMTVTFDSGAILKEKEDARFKASVKNAKVTIMKREGGGGSSAARALDDGGSDRYQTTATKKKVDAGAGGRNWRQDDDDDDEVVMSGGSPTDRGAAAGGATSRRPGFASVNPIVQAFALINQLHTKRETIIPLSTDPLKDGTPMPIPTTPFKLEDMKAIREGGVVESASMERWSTAAFTVLPEDHSLYQLKSRVQENFFAFGAIASGKAIKASFICNMPIRNNHFAFLTAMTSPSISEICHQHSTLSALVGSRRQPRGRGRGPLLILDVDIPAKVQMLVKNSSNNGTDQGDQGGNKKKKGGKGSGKKGKDEDVGSIAKIFKQFSAPIHMLLEVNIIRVLQHLAQLPKAYGPTKARLKELLGFLLLNPVEESRAHNSEDRGEEDATLDELENEMEVEGVVHIDISPLSLGREITCPVFDIASVYNGSSKVVYDDHDEDEDLRLRTHEQSHLDLLTALEFMPVDRVPILKEFAQIWETLKHGEAESGSRAHQDLQRKYRDQQRQQHGQNTAVGTHQECQSTHGCRNFASAQDKGDKKWYCRSCFESWEEDHGDDDDDDMPRRTNNNSGGGGRNTAAMTAGGGGHNAGGRGASNLANANGGTHNSHHDDVLGGGPLRGTIIKSLSVGVSFLLAANTEFPGDGYSRGHYSNALNSIWPTLSVGHYGKKSPARYLKAVAKGEEFAGGIYIRSMSSDDLRNKHWASGNADAEYVFLADPRCRAEAMDVFYFLEVANIVSRAQDPVPLDALVMELIDGMGKLIQRRKLSFGDARDIVGAALTRGASSEVFALGHRADGRPTVTLARIPAEAASFIPFSSSSKKAAHGAEGNKKKDKKEKKKASNGSGDAAGKEEKQKLKEAKKNAKAALKALKKKQK